MPPESSFGADAGSATDTGADAVPATHAGNGHPTATSIVLNDTGRGTPEPVVTPEGDESGRTAAQGIRQWFLFWPVLAYLVARAATVAGAAAFDGFTHKSLHADLYIWDGQWFIRAALHGWPGHLPMAHGHVARNTIAFFPALPLGIRWLTELTRLSPLVVGLVISGVTGLTAVVAVGMLVRRYRDSPSATRATLLFAVFPGTFVFSLAYAEGIVITCVAFGLLALLRRQWWLAGLLGLVATAASPIALAFVLSCAWCAGREVLRHRTWHALIAPVLAPLGFIAYMAWLWGHTGVLSAWRLTERGGWKSGPSLTYPIHVVTTFLFNPAAPTETGQILVAGTAVAVVGAVLAIREPQPAPVLIYGLAAGLLAAVSSPVGLRPRFIMLAFPLVLAYGIRLRGRLYTAAVVISVLLLAAMTVLELGSTAVFP
ncbi:MAG: hypothetical protein ABSF33_01245 [Acidimicrobiales bacterium]|jgi:hypothetical protein